MRIVYLGTPEFSVLPLKSIVENTNHQVVGVVCNKDKPVGRKKIMTAPPVKLYAQEKGIKVFQYDKIRLEGVEDLQSLKPDMMITCAFGQILSQEILDIPEKRKGFFAKTGPDPAEKGFFPFCTKLEERNAAFLML